MPRAEPVRYAVLCSPDDANGPWARTALMQRGLGGVRVVTTEEIVYSTRIVHRQVRGEVSSEITLPDGTVLGPGLQSVLNRVVAVPSAHLMGTDEADRSYAVQELYALLVSVLASLPGVVNAAGPRGLPGPWLREAEWLCEAGRAGLAGIGFRWGRPPSEQPAPDRRLLVIGDEVVAPGGAVGVPAAVEEGCRALATRVGATILGVDFVTDQGAWLFAGANPVPDLRSGGDPAGDALVRLMAAGVLA